MVFGRSAAGAYAMRVPASEKFWMMILLELAVRRSMQVTQRQQASIRSCRVFADADQDAGGERHALLAAMRMVASRAPAPYRASRGGAPPCASAGPRRSRA